MSAAKRKGTAAESAVVAYLRERGAVHAERRALNGNKDRGDITGIPGVCVEVKDHARLALAEWIDEATTEGHNAGATVTAVWHKRRGKGSPGAWYVAMTGEQFVNLLTEAGYIR